MTPAELEAALAQIVARSIPDSELVGAPRPVVMVERPRVRAHGDYATAVALELGRLLHRPPRTLAEELAVQIRAVPGIREVEVAGPGFLNLRLSAEARGQVAGVVCAQGVAYGASSAASGQRINVEFVSANPTGPMHVGHARWAAVGDALARLLAATGAEVAREFYVNDAGRQITLLGESLRARALQARGHDAATPADGYQGDYVAEVAGRILEGHPGVLEQPVEAQLATFTAEGLRILLGEIQASLESFGVHFDRYYSERAGLHDSGAIPAAIARLRAQGHVYDADGAVWLRTTDFGDDKDRVLLRSTGEPTYFAADAAYYLDKRDRGFDKVIILLGADHHGYIQRMRAIAAAAGDDPEDSLELLIGQMVSLTRHGEPVKMSKRAGDFVAFDDLLEAVGVDAARYSLVRSSIDSALELDLDLIGRQSAENPVYYVQYAHARIASLLRHADDLGIGLPPPAQVDYGLLVQDRESDLLAALADFPRIVAAAAARRAPHGLARYLEELAGTYHRFYDSCRVLPLGDERPGELTGARLTLCAATRIVLANGLGLLGVRAPERM